MNDIYKAAGIIIEDKKLLVTRAKDMEFFIDPGGKIERVKLPSRHLRQRGLLTNRRALQK